MDKWDGQSLTRQIDNVLAYLGYGPDDSDDMEAAVIAGPYKASNHARQHVPNHYP